MPRVEHRAVDDRLGQGARWLIVERGDPKQAAWQQVTCTETQTESQAMSQSTACNMYHSYTSVVLPDLLVLGPAHLQCCLMCSRCKSHIIAVYHLCFIAAV